MGFNLGFKGLSELQNIDDIPPDFMHCICPPFIKLILWQICLWTKY